MWPQNRVQAGIHYCNRWQLMAQAPHMRRIAIDVAPPAAPAGPFGQAARERLPTCPV